MESKLKHLEMIQGVINRMARNSFFLKGWTIVIVSALFALVTNNASVWLVCLAYFPTLAFWILDGYYLRQEKMYRKLYDRGRIKNEADIDFSMDTCSVIAETESWFRVSISKTLSILYGIIIIVITIAVVIVL